MEEPRPGQAPATEQRSTVHGVHEKAAPGPHKALPTDKERQQIDEAQQRADADRKELRATGHGDHKGTEGF
ncbi:hypothetical protein [Sphingobium bisphenolivorans]|uniref:hypothetical protein n=1 Tax=Sphingobium bisphenolivorans TaxID=1335760 RepID=UPI0003B2FE59|nr:hypothetical protein [Sphingobium bisphenolivorans]